MASERAPSVLIPSTGSRRGSYILDLEPQSFPQRTSRTSFHVAAASMFSFRRQSQDHIASEVTYGSEPPSDPIQMVELESQSWPVSSSPTLQKSNEVVETRSTPTAIDRAVWTRNLCVIALIMGWAISIAAISLGAFILKTSGPMPSFLLGKSENMGFVDYSWPVMNYAYKYLRGHRAYSFPKAVMVLISLLLNIGLTIVLDCMNYIPTTTLRWSLLREGREYFNSNLRLFTSAKHGPNRWFVNLIAGLSLAISYGATSVITSDIYVDGVATADGNTTFEDVPGPVFGIDFNGWGIFWLGLGLAMQAMVSTWCLVRSGMVLTWSSDPLSNAKACLYAGILTASPRYSEPFNNPFNSRLPPSGHSQASPTTIPHGMRSSHSHQWGSQSETFTETRSYTATQAVSIPTFPFHSKSNTETPTMTSGTICSLPRMKQLPVRSLAPKARHIPRILWVLFGLLSIWTVVVGSLAAHYGNASRAYVLEDGGRGDALSYWQTFGQIFYPIRDTFTKDRRDWLCVVLQIVVQSFITLGLHCVELVTNMFRDEAAWRKATSTGASMASNSLISAATSWHAIALLIFKSLAQWVFSAAFSANLFITMSLLPILTLAVMFFVLAVATELLTRYKPKGAQPSTFGNVKLLAELIDEWDHERMFWGDKGEMIPAASDVRIAGTAGHRLAELRMNAEYVGLYTEPVVDNSKTGKKEKKKCSWFRRAS